VEGREIFEDFIEKESNVNFPADGMFKTIRLKVN